MSLPLRLNRRTVPLRSASVTARRPFHFILNAHPSLGGGSPSVASIGDGTFDGVGMYRVCSVRRPEREKWQSPVPTLLATRSGRGGSPRAGAVVQCCFLYTSGRSDYQGSRPTVAIQ